MVISVYAIPGVDKRYVSKMEKKRLKLEVYAADMKKAVRIKAIVLEYYRLPDYKVDTRQGPYVRARYMAMNLIKLTTRLTLDDIGGMFSEQSHCTVKHAITTINNMVETNRAFRETYNEVLTLIKQKLNDNKTTTSQGDGSTKEAHPGVCCH